MTILSHLRAKSLWPDAVFLFSALVDRPKPQLFSIYVSKMVKIKQSVKYPIEQLGLGFMEKVLNGVGCSVL